MNKITRKEALELIELDKYRTIPDSISRLSMATLYFALLEQEQKDIQSVFLQESKKLSINLIDRINEKNDQFPFGFMIKLFRSPKGSHEWYEKQKCSNGLEAVRQLITSERIFEDIELAQSNNYPIHLYMREWIDIDPELEFRCFIKDKKIVGISQYDYHVVLSERYTKLKDSFDYAIRQFLECRLIPHLCVSDVVVDVYIKYKVCGNIYEYEVRLIELNPFNVWTDPCLFNWNKEFDGTFRINKINEK